MWDQGLSFMILLTVLVYTVKSINTKTYIISRICCVSLTMSLNVTKIHKYAVASFTYAVVIYLHRNVLHML